jgi:glycosyltransferase involved in cell wall biosynthesis
LSKDDRIIYIKNEKNLKLTASLNKWLNLSRWKYIARIDDDDIWMDGKLETQIKFMEKNTDYWLLWTGSIIMDDEWKVLGYLSVKEDDKKIRKNILSGNQFVHSSVLFRKAALKEVWWYYDVKYNWAEDYELWLRMWQKSKFANINEPLIKYRWLETSISRKKWLKQWLLSIKISIVNRNHYSCFFKSFLIRIISTFIPQKIKRYILLKK